MTPDIDLRISTMIRAMEQVVSPALDKDNNLAREQAALVIGQLRLIAAQWKHSEAYAASCLDDLLASVGALTPKGGVTTQAAYDRLKQCVGDRNINSVEDHYKKVMTLVDQLIRQADEDGDRDFRKTLHRTMLDFSRRQSLRDRSWFALSGFDLKPDELKPMGELIGEHST